MRLVSALLPLAMFACQTPEGFAPEENPDEANLVFGTDDRVDYYEVSNPDHLAMMDATVAMVDDSWLYRSGAGWRFYNGATLAQTEGVCSTEPFANQPTVASCSGVFVGEDLIATAGHCITSQNACNRTSFVFNYRKQGAGANQVNTYFTTNDVYSCSQIVDRYDDGSADWAVVRVNRDIVGHTAADIRRSGTVPNNTPLVLVGHPSGLPAKLADNATVRSNVYADFFGANLDAFGGNSGSPVFNENTGKVEGILVRGFADYQRSGGCFVSNVCNNNGCPGFESSTRVTLFEDLIPDLNSGAPSCADDGYENNDTLNNAAVLSDGNYADLAICGAAESDWYAVNVFAGQDFTATISFTHSAGDLDMEIWDGNTQVAVSDTTDNVETLSYTPSTSTTMYVRVYGYNNAENDYDLEVDLGGTGLILGGNPTVDAGDWYTFNISGGPINERLTLYAGNPNGTSNVAGCGGLTTLRNPIRVSRPWTDATGSGQATLLVPAHLSGVYHLQVVATDSCEVSNVFQMTVQ